MDGARQIGKQRDHLGRYGNNLSGKLLQLGQSGQIWIFVKAEVTELPAGLNLGCVSKSKVKDDPEASGTLGMMLTKKIC